MIRGMAIIAGLATVTGLSACEPLPAPAAAAPATGAATQPDPISMPGSLASLAAPYQDVSTARLKSDGCYWYTHVGPVETTELPLRTPQGNPICARAPS